MLAPFGISERLVRSSVFRLTSDDWLEAQRTGRRSLYRLTEFGKRRFERAHEKIYFRPDSRWNGDWLFVLMRNKIPSNKRLGLVRELAWEGLRCLGPRVFARPGGDLEAVAEIVDRLALRRDVILCCARDFEVTPAQPLRSATRELWDFESVRERYAHFLARFRILSRLLANGEELDPELSFVLRTLVIHAFRRVLLHDPLLPVEFTPRTWPGTAAYDLCRSIYAQVWRGAEQRIIAALGESGRSIPKNAPFYRRFAGLGETR